MNENNFDDGFLSEVVEGWSKEFKESYSTWFGLTYEINRHAVDVLKKIAPTKNSDKELIAAALFARAVQSFEASIILAEKGMQADSGIIARNVIETTLYIGGLAAIENFSEEMVSSNNNHVEKLAKGAAAVLEGSDSREERERAEELLSLVREVKNSGDKYTPIDLKKLASRVDMLDFYEIAYRQLSGDSSHPSLESCERHFSRDANGRVVKMIFNPQFSGMEKILSPLIAGILRAMEVISGIFTIPGLVDSVEHFNAVHHIISSRMYGNATGTRPAAHA